MGAEMTKWLIDSKVEDIHKKMPWRDGDDDGRKEQQQADSVVDDLGQMFGSRSEEEVEQGTSSRYLPFALCVAIRPTVVLATSSPLFFFLIFFLC
jgi:hypothetical protein